MAFSSVQFLFVFLPLSLAALLVVSRLTAKLPEQHLNHCFK